MHRLQVGAGLGFLSPELPLVVDVPALMGLLLVAGVCFGTYGLFALSASGAVLGLSVVTVGSGFLKPQTILYYTILYYTISLRLLKSGLLNVRLTLFWKKFKFKSLKSKLNEHIMNSTQSSSIDIDEALLSSSNEEERRKLAKSFGGDWSEGEEDANQNRAILKEIYEKELVNEANKCFLLKSRAYNDNINDALIPAIAIELKVIY